MRRRNRREIQFFHLPLTPVKCLSDLTGQGRWQRSQKFLIKSKESWPIGPGFGLPLKGVTINNFKSEIRISKFETNPNIKFPNVQNIETFDHYK